MFFFLSAVAAVAAAAVATATAAAAAPALRHLAWECCALNGRWIASLVAWRRGDVVPPRSLVVLFGAGDGIRAKKAAGGRWPWLERREDPRRSQPTSARTQEVGLSPPTARGSEVPRFRGSSPPRRGGVSLASDPKKKVTLFLSFSLSWMQI